MKERKSISVFSRVLLILAAILLATNIFLPIWKIELYAPQYPEGLALLIYADRLAGDVEIINGLNHYIGMKTLHTEDFIEFTLLRYILAFFSLLILVSALVGRKKLVYITFALFVIFCVVAMADFYRWNYDYGHDLDPNAAIKVPGMAYQPPLIGFKQLLNFGAYSIPDTGGWMMVAAGLIMLLVIFLERAASKKRKKSSAGVPAMWLLLPFFAWQSCGSPGPRPVKINDDVCAFCRMTITDLKFATQLTTAKGRQYVFDDVICLVTYRKENANQEYERFYAADFSQPDKFVPLDEAFIIESDSLRSPMGGNYAAFANQDSARVYQSRFQAKSVTWAELGQ